MLPPDIVERLESILGGAIRQTGSVGGGCIGKAARIQIGKEDFFVKWSRDEAAQTFPAEAAGLAAMREAGASLIIPKPIHVDAGADSRAGLLVMPWIESGPQGSRFWEDFGQGFAAMHHHTSDQFGFGEANFIGRLPQDNTWESSWPAFVRRRRLQPQVERARSSGRWNSTWNAALERLYARLQELLPERPEASILHGDLWSGNFMVSRRGEPVLIDPATYFGHREADLAMTELFGGFDPRFYDAYRSAWPLDRGYDERREIYNLYHLINHLNHFGSSYAGSVGSILLRY